MDSEIYTANVTGSISVALAFVTVYKLPYNAGFLKTFFFLTFCKRCCIRLNVEIRHYKNHK